MRKADMRKIVKRFSKTAVHLERIKNYVSFQNLHRACKPRLLIKGWSHDKYDGRALTQNFSTKRFP